MDYGTLCSHYLEKEDPPSSDVINNLKLIRQCELREQQRQKEREVAELHRLKEKYE